jgi:hypothetical protein
MIARALAMTVIAFLVAGCTPMQWQHAVSGTPPSQADLSYCEQSAYYEAQRQAFLNDFMWPRFAYDRNGLVRPLPFGTYPYRDRFFLERDLFDYCMRAKGYRLVPVRPADRSD